MLVGLLLWISILKLAEQLHLRPVPYREIPRALSCAAVGCGSGDTRRMLPNFGGLLTAQFLLGVAEAAVAPGFFSLITGMFYKTRSSRAGWRRALWFLGNAVANVVFRAGSV